MTFSHVIIVASDEKSSAQRGGLKQLRRSDTLRTEVESYGTQEGKDEETESSQVHSIEVEEKNESSQASDAKGGGTAKASRAWPSRGWRIGVL